MPCHASSIINFIFILFFLTNFDEMFVKGYMHLNDNGQDLLDVSPDSWYARQSRPTNNGPCADAYNVHGCSLLPKVDAHRVEAREQLEKIIDAHLCRPRLDHLSLLQHGLHALPHGRIERTVRKRRIVQTAPRLVICLEHAQHALRFHDAAQRLVLPVEADAHEAVPLDKVHGRDGLMAGSPITMRSRD